jgi:hypothetical protein
MTEFRIPLLFENLNNLSKLQIGLEKSLISTEKTGDAWKVLNEQISQTSTEINKINTRKDAFGDLISGTVFSRFEKFRSKLSMFNTKIEKMGGAGKVKADFFDMFKNIGDQAGVFAKNLKLMTAGGMKGLLVMGKAALSALVTGFTSLLAVAAPFLPIIIAVVAGVLILKRMWTLNIGGMQTQFHRFMGQLKDLWAKFTINFDTTLRKLSPLFTTVFSVLGAALRPIIAIAKNLMDVFFALITPIVDALGAIKTDGGAAVGIFDTLTKLIQFLGAIAVPIFTGIGKVLAFSMKPMISLIENVHKLLKLLGIVKEEEEGVVASSEKMMQSLTNRRGIMDALKQQSSSESNVVNNNQQVTVMSAGNISESNAPMIGNMLSQTMINNQKL